MPEHRPPRWADYLLEKFVNPRFLEDIQGNLEEIFKRRVREVGVARARRAYAWAAVRHLTPYFTKKSPSQYPTVSNLSPAMLNQYLTYAWRHFAKNRQFTFLNAVGLTTGLICTLFIYLWINDEMLFDQFHEKDARLYQVMVHEKGGGKLVTSEGTGGILRALLPRDMPEVEMAVCTTPPVWFQKFSLTRPGIANEGRTVSAAGNFVSSDYFKAFSFPLIQGNAQSALAGKNTVAISAQMATRLFGSPEKAMNQLVEWKWQAFSRKCLVTGVFQDQPHHSSEQSELLIPLSAWDDILPQGSMPNTTTGPFHNYLVLRPGADAQLLEAKLADYAKKRFNDPNATLFIRKYSDGYLYGNYENGIQSGGRIEYVRLFGAIAVFILLIACINFMNLSTAKASVRVKEVGVKKALGAGRTTLVFQFLGESILMSFLTLLLALGVVWLTLPYFNAITNKQLTLHFSGQFVAALAAILLLTGLIAGSYPALYLSRFNPALTLKGKLLHGMGELWVRKGLVVFQFAVSVIFIISVVVVYRQIDYVQTKNQGYEKDNIVYFEMEGRAASQTEAFLARLKALPGVENASSIQQKIILPTFMPSAGVRWDGKNEKDEVRFYKMPVNYGLTETLGIRMTAGRSFSKDFGSDSTAVILNETAVRQMDIADPIGKQITIDGFKVNIVGVAQDFHFNSLHEAIKPFIFRLSPQETMLATVKIQPGQVPATIARMQAFYASFNPGYAFDYEFLDRDYQIQYASEQLVAQLARYFAVLAILISCLGLFGLAAFTAERRRKEIGVRKVLGATTGSVVAMLSREFLALVMIAIAIGCPLAWWLTQRWLDHFAYRATIGAGIYVAAGLATIIITLATISFQSVRAALTNPTQSLKSE
ncbi:duplicated orphan permease [Dyadobacter sp. SG02]|uniref:ABC transporter permease n=1 Tax=Dyadobacter sp. SG02 TaxID=1855291 RepID=UPI0008B88F36|nr:ABC transporter permease [Dyadobacter sp. SG02]SEJ64747.1 duplicated orphan permease [Dyadobacter sp. SG02]